MIIEPRIRGFICTTAHPLGCAANVDAQIGYVTGQAEIAEGPKRVLVLGASGGYGLASRIVAAFGCGAATLGVSFERPPAESRTATAGWYNNHAFQARATARGLYARTIDGDAFSDELKQQVIDAIVADLGQIDLLVYSLASPVRQHPRTGELHRSVIKPLGETFHVKTLNVARGVVHEVDLEPADEAETEATVAVMGGEDWEYWIDALAEAGVLADGFRTVSYTYIGSELTWPIYWHATLGKAKEDLDRAAAAISAHLGDVDGGAQVAVLKAVVTQASAAIPVVPLYNTLLFAVMKEQGSHEDCIDHVYRLFASGLYSASPEIDEVGRLRLDDRELAPAVQDEVLRRWSMVCSENLEELGDLEGFRADFLRLFGFGMEGVDYTADLDPTSSDL
jgi:enoyl-[acyl-carrier protein] reductase/trans-2-enoyl-CoA reductase (NAD+)